MRKFMITVNGKSYEVYAEEIKDGAAMPVMPAAPAAAPAVFEQDRFRFDFDRLDFAVEGRPLQLSQTEQRLLRLLVENRGHTLPRDTLLDRIWTDGADYVDENALSVTVGRLRRKLGKNAPIKTVYGVGYSWAVET